MCAARTYDAVEALVQVTRGGKPVAILRPQKRHFWVQQTDNSQAAISVNWARDLFVAMGNPLGDNAWSMRIQYKPLGSLHLAGRRGHGVGRLRCGHRSALSGQGAGRRGTGDRAAGRRPRPGIRLMWKFLLPFAAVHRAGGAVRLRSESQPRYPRPAFAAHRQAGAGVRAHRRAGCQRAPSAMPP